jgi:prepilin-type N-terminal cleavage/methylation domain-containing protein
MTRAARRGFTLVEVLVAVIVMSIALIVLITCFSGAVGIQRKARAHTLAQNTAQSKLETLRSTGWSGLTFGTTTVAVPGLTNGTMTTTVTLQAVSLAKIRVRVEWSPTVAGEERYRRGHVEYVTYLAQPAP